MTVERMRRLILALAGFCAAVSAGVFAERRDWGPAAVNTVLSLPCIFSLVRR